MIGGFVLAAAVWWWLVRLLVKLYKHDTEGRDE